MSSKIQTSISASKRWVRVDNLVTVKFTFQGSGSLLGPFFSIMTLNSLTDLMSTPSPEKLKLIELIEAYASAKATANEALLRMAASGLQSFLMGHEVTVVEQETETESDNG